MFNEINSNAIISSKELTEYWTGKRKAEEKIEDSELKSELKYVKTEKIELCWTTLIEKVQPVVREIISYLSIKDLKNFELVAKSCRNLTSTAWKQWQEKDLLDFEWGDCERTIPYPYRAKWNYCLGATLMQYIREKERFIESKLYLESKDLSKWEKKIKDNFLIKDFPSFSCYVQMDLLTLRGISSKELSEEVKIQRQLIKTEANNKVARGGDLLLEGLLQINELTTANTDTALANIANLLKRAIKKKATCASLLAINIISMNTNPIYIDNSWIEDLVLAAAKEQDLRALEKYVAKASFEEINSLYMRGNFELPILTELAFLTFSLHPDVEKEKALLEKIKEQGGKKALGKIASVKLNQRKFAEAEFFYSRAYPDYVDHASAVVLTDMAYLKARLRKMTEAESLYDRAFQMPDNQLSAKMLTNAAFVKIYVDKVTEAEDLYDRALQLCDKQVLPVIWAGTAVIKFRLKKLDEAKAFYEQAIRVSENNRSTDMSELLDLLKSNLFH